MGSSPRFQYFFQIKTHRKRVFIILNLRKHEAEYLRKNGYEDCVIQTNHGHYKKYRMVEKKSAMEKLAEYQESIKIN